ncbi:NAD-dependent malic enzyme, partial [Cylindrospermopsis raciborskii CS-506_C]
MTNLTPNSSFSVTLRLKIPNRVGMLASVTQAIALTGGNIGQIDLIEQNRHNSIRDITVDAASGEHGETIVNSVKELTDIQVINVYDRTFNLHEGGKISIASRIPIKTVSDLAMAYTPGVGRICQAIAQKPEEVYRLTIKQNTVAIVTDGSAVLGLGNLGPEAALPVMEGKAMLFKEFADIDAFPICLDTQDTEEIIRAVKNIAPVFGGVNLEDIAAPRCFEIEQRLQSELDIPIFHDDQNGTAIVTLAALLNALKLVNKSINQIRIVINGAGAAGIAVARLLRKAGAEQIWMCDSQGIISTNRTDLNPE